MCVSRTWEWEATEAWSTGCRCQEENKAGLETPQPESQVVDALGRGGSLGNTSHKISVHTVSPMPPGHVGS